ncbi:MAG TPA: prephenate dehydrogenase [Candidatus Sulfomarinibacteraceae bacterium]|nr:prephenate dehydrogenase [Candidatus Sulfomarinibacteraceae bacterium]
MYDNFPLSGQGSNSTLLVGDFHDIMQRMFRLKEAHITIVGLGLMGGSLALGLRPHVERITAVDLDGETRALAMGEGLVERATADLGSGLQGANLVVLATPVGGILRVLEQLPALRPDGCYVLDLGSTKGDICQAMNRLPGDFAAIGGHPMCGKETSGLPAAEATLFRDQTFVLCRTQRTTEALEVAVLSLLQALEARPLFLAPQQHDRLVGLVSHLPYLIASLLMAQVSAHAAEQGHTWQVSSSGFRDTTRLAGSDPGMMADIVRTNRTAITTWLRQYGERLDDLVQMLDNDDDEGLYEWLKARQGEHHAYRRQKQDR